MFTPKLIVCLSVNFVIFLWQVTGEITYNGYKFSEFVPQKTSAYISQYDIHIPEMTVRETLDFSARCQGVGSRAGTFSAQGKFCFYLNISCLWWTDDESWSLFCFKAIMCELSRREIKAGILPDPDIDTYMKVDFVPFAF